MPRLRTDDDAETAVEAEYENEIVANGEVKTSKPRRVPPAGLQVGSVEPEKVDAPPAGASRGRRGRTTSRETLNLLNLCNENPGDWFRVGVFGSQSQPVKDSELANAGIVYQYEPHPEHEGYFVRYASKVVA